MINIFNSELELIAKEASPTAKVLIIQLEGDDNPAIPIMENAKKAQTALNGNLFHLCKVHFTKHFNDKERTSNFKFYLKDLKRALDWLYFKV